MDPKMSARLFAKRSKVVNRNDERYFFHWWRSEARDVDDIQRRDETVE